MDVNSVTSPVDVTQSATQPRVSIDSGVMRWLKLLRLDDAAARGERLGEALGLVRQRAAAVVVVLVVHPRRAGLERLAAVGDGRLRVVVDEHGVGRVAGRVAVGRDHHRDRLTVVADAALGQQGVARLAGGARRVRAARDAAGEAERLGRDAP